MSWETSLIAGGIGVGLFLGCILGFLMAGWAGRSE